MRRIAALIGTLILLGACAEPVARVPGTNQPIDATTQQAFDTKRMTAALAGLDQCLAFFRTGSYDTAALAAAGYQTYKPVLKRSGFKAIYGVEERGLLDVRHELSVELFFREGGGLGARTNCQIISRSGLLTSTLAEGFAERGFVPRPDPRVRRGFEFNKGSESVSYFVTHNLDTGIYEHDFRLNE